MKHRPIIQLVGAMRPLVLSALVALALFSITKAAFADSEKNLAIMVEAASRLEFKDYDWRDGSAQMLVMHSTLADSRVAVVFGYVDNAAACNDIATTMTSTTELRGRSDLTYSCVPVAED